MSKASETPSILSDEQRELIEFLDAIPKDKTPSTLRSENLLREIREERSKELLDRVNKE